MRIMRDRVPYGLPVRTQRAITTLGGDLLMHAPHGVQTVKTKAGNIPAEWLVPSGAAPGRAILYLHGGGYCVCGPSTHRAMVGALARVAGVRALVIDYRLAPENPFPAAIDDGMTAYRWLLAQGYDPARIVVGGDSAGAGMTLSLCINLRDTGLPMPKAIFLLSPWIDLTHSGETINTLAKTDIYLSMRVLNLYSQCYAGQTERSHPLISPLFADLHRLPPTLIHVAGAEMLLSDSIRLAERLKAAGVDTQLEIWENMWHVFQAFVPFAPEGWKSIEKIGMFIKNQP